jgi:hypothetical protein
VTREGKANFLRSELPTRMAAGGWKISSASKISNGSEGSRAPVTAAEFVMIWVRITWGPESEKTQMFRDLSQSGPLAGWKSDRNFCPEGTTQFYW